MQARGRKLLRVMIAAVFGFMSLVHGPVMTFAKAAPGGAHHDSARMGHAGHHQHHHDAMDEQGALAEHDTVPVCYAFGCFVVLDAAPIRTPTAILLFAGRVTPAPAEALHAGSIEPAVPPPRLSV